jgi:maltose O-acetyltransferase
VHPDIVGHVAGTARPAAGRLPGMIAADDIHTVILARHGTRHTTHGAAAVFPRLLHGADLTMMRPETVAPGRTHKQRMLAGELYRADDPQLAAEFVRGQQLAELYNAIDPADLARRDKALAELLGGIGLGCEVRAPLRVDFGYNIRLGDRVFVNYNAVMLDVAAITIGDDTLIGPNVQLLTPTHPLDPRLRREKWESGRPITIGRNVWLGGGVIVCPGVTIGDDAVVGAGSVVTRDLPADTTAVGNPARVIKTGPPQETHLGEHEVDQGR